MANWKKVIVSGSNANLTTIQVDNLISGQVVIGGGSGSNLSTTAINGTGTIVATTGATGVVITGSFTGSFKGDGSGLTGIPATISNAVTFSEGLTNTSFDGSVPITVAVSGAVDLTNNIITKWNNTENKFAVSSITDNGTTVSGATSLQFSGAASNLTGSFSGSFVGDGSGLTGLSSGASTLTISASIYNGQPLTSGSINLSTQGLTVTGTQNEVDAVVSGQTITIGLPSDVTISNNLIVTNDLTVNGTTTYINVTDLYVEDKFILLASGSATNGDGGIVIDRGTYAAGNISFGFDSGTNRWGYQDGVADGNNTIDPTSANGVSGSFAGIVFTEGAHGSTKPITGEFAVAGAIYTANDGTIYMYA